MKVHLRSDLHIKHYFDGSNLPSCDLVVIAGDISDGFFDLDVIEIANSRKDLKFLIVPGNHDYQSGKPFEHFEKHISNVTDECSNVIVLNDSSVNIDGVDFFGGTMWSGLDAYGMREIAFMKSFYETISDCMYIANWSADLMIEKHEEFLRKLNDFEAKTRGNRRVVVSHFAPSLKSVHARFAHDIPANGYWCNNFSDSLIGKFDFWLHGHVHNNFDYNVSGCRVVCNPVGYSSAYGIENPEFNPSLIIEI